MVTHIEQSPQKAPNNLLSGPKSKFIGETTNKSSFVYKAIDREKMEQALEAK
jgi:hypothetical protein